MKVQRLGLPLRVAGFLAATACLALGCGKSSVDSAATLAQEILGYAPSAADRKLAGEFLAGCTADEAEIAAVLRSEREAFAEATASAPAPARFRIMLLYFARQAVARGLTDAALKREVESGRRQAALAAALDAPAGASCAAALNELAPEELARVLPLLAGCYFIGDNPYSEETLTWAAESLADFDRALMQAGLARHSVAAKLLIEAGRLRIPAAARADFVWSHGPSIAVPLAVGRAAEDASGLRALLESRHAFYREAAAAALAQPAARAK
ncbi:MAG: hypothetical protein HZA54_05240 [Planctomycetes bacterium]|nr:hypothetical protein [Planctomycetota bacterium]